MPERLLQRALVHDGRALRGLAQQTRAYEGLDVKLIIDLGTISEQYYLEVTRDEHAHLSEYARGKHGTRLTALVTEAWKLSELVKRLELVAGSANLLPGDWGVTRPEDATTHETVFGIPLRVTAYEVLTTQPKDAYK